MNLLSIDPSSSAPGYAFFEESSPIWCVTNISKYENIIDRMREVLAHFVAILDFRKPDYIAIETPYIGISKSTSMKMGQIFGMYYATFLWKGYSNSQIIEIHPMTAKKAAGLQHFKNREEAKQTIYKRIKELYPNLDVKDDNSSDAVAVGLAALDVIKERKYER